MTTTNDRTNCTDAQCETISVSAGHTASDFGTSTLESDERVWWPTAAGQAYLRGMADALPAVLETEERAL